MNSRNTWFAACGSAVALLVLAASSPAAGAAPTTYTFTGSGWGHGVGMSQYGAKGGASAGRSYAQILARYYKDTALGSPKLPSKIRVGLRQGATEIALSGNGRFDFKMSGERFATARADQTWRVRPTSAGAYRVLAPDGRRWVVGDARQWLEIRFAEFGTLLRIDGVRYKRGYLELDTYRLDSAYALRSIAHVVSFDAYVYGVAEMPSSWPVEALKAQAVAARTYALQKYRTSGVRSDCRCHVYDDTRHQVYAGYEKEAGSWGARWRSAVDATKGVVLLHSGNPVNALYFSSSGGYTEHNNYVWSGDPVPYLRGVRDPWDEAQSPYMDWSVTFSRAELEERLASRSSTDVGSLTSLTVLDPRGVSGRVTRVLDSQRGGVRIAGNKGIKRVSGETLRSVLRLRSTLTDVSTAMP